MKINKIILSALLAGTIIATPMMYVWASSSSDSSGNWTSSGNGETWQQGGAATNQTTEGVAKVQEAVATTAAWIGMISSSVSMVMSFMPQSYMLEIPYDCGTGTCKIAFGLAGGPTRWGLNTDVLGAAVDGWAVYDAYNKQAGLSEEPGEYQAAVRYIGDSDDLESSETDATLDSTEVHVSTLQNVGLEALEDVAGSVLISPEELIAATSTIQEGFGTTEKTKEVDGKTETVSRTDEEIQKISSRKEKHLQYTGTAGVARADLGSVVAESERKQYSRLSSYVGSGDGVIANIKVLCSLDLTLAQRLNLLNMLYGQQAANEAATALQHLETK